MRAGTLIAAIVSAVVVAAWAAPAGAERVTLGLPAPTEAKSGFGACKAECTVLQTALPNPNALTPPAAGRIVEWWALASAVGKPFSGARLRVMATTAEGNFEGVGTSEPETLGFAQVVYPTGLPIERNDLIGLTIPAGEEVILAAQASEGSVMKFIPSAVADHTSASAEKELVLALELGATVALTPVVSSVSPTSGGIGGGTKVVVKGNHLTESTEVRFGSTPAASFTVDSNTQITAVAPPLPAGTVDVTVSGAGGTDAISSVDHYTVGRSNGSPSTSSLAFGTQRLGTSSATKKVVFTNHGSFPISIGAVSLEGAAAGDFTRLSDACAGMIVPASGSCAIVLSFTPTALGPRLARLTIGDDASGGPHRVTLTGEGVSGLVPSNAFSIGRLSHLRLAVKVASHGTVRVVDGGGRHARKLLRFVSASGGPGTVIVRLRLTTLAKRRLHHRHSIRVKARITFAPVGGTPATRVVTLRVRR